VPKVVGVISDCNNVWCTTDISVGDTCTFLQLRVQEQDSLLLEIFGNWWTADHYITLMLRTWQMR